MPLLEMSNTLVMSGYYYGSNSFHWLSALSYINKLTKQKFPPFFLFVYVPWGMKTSHLSRSESLLDNILTLEFNSCFTWISIFVLIQKSTWFYILNRCKKVNSWYSTSQVRGVDFLIFFLKLTSSVRNTLLAFDGSTAEEHHALHLKCWIFSTDFFSPKSWWTTTVQRCS